MNIFLDNVNIKYSKFEEGMTNDGHIFFDSKNDLDFAYLVLSDAKLNNEKMFYVEKDHNFKNELFFKLNNKSVSKPDVFNDLIFVACRKSSKLFLT